MKLYSGPLSMFGAKAEIAAHEKGLAFELVMVPFEMKTLYQPKHPEVLRINPKRQVPVLIDGDLEIFDSTQIFEYFESIKPDPALWPAEPKARNTVCCLVEDGDPAAIEARAAALSFYDGMEKAIADKEWLAGSYSYADIAFYMAQIFGDRMGAPMTDAHPKLQAWRDRMSARPPVRKVAGAMGRYLLSQGRKLPAFLAKMSA